MMSPYDVNKRTDKQWYDEILAWLILPWVFVSFIVVQLWKWARGKRA